MADDNGDVAYLVALGYELADLEQLSPEAIAAMAAEERSVGAATAAASKLPSEVLRDPVTPERLRAIIEEAILRTADDLGVPRSEVAPLLAADRQVAALVDVANAAVNPSPPSGPPVCPLCGRPHLFGSGSCVR